MDIALEKLGEAPPDVFNHNLETTPVLYRKARPGADYHWSLELNPEIQVTASWNSDEVRSHAGTGRRD